MTQVTDENVTERKSLNKLNELANNNSMVETRVLTSL